MKISNLIQFSKYIQSVIRSPNVSEYENTYAFLTMSVYRTRQNEYELWLAAPSHKGLEKKLPNMSIHYITCPYLPNRSRYQSHDMDLITDPKASIISTRLCTFDHPAVSWMEESWHSLRCVCLCGCVYMCVQHVWKDCWGMCDYVEKRPGWSLLKRLLRIEKTSHPLQGIPKAFFASLCAIFCKTHLSEE